MMPSLISTNNMAGASHMPYTAFTADSMLDELSRQLGSVSSRRLSRGSGSQRAGNAMRISKPGSASNSPRSAVLQSRRRTLMGERVQGQPHLLPLDAGYLPTPAHELAHEPVYEPETRPARPVSWHPTSHHHLPQQQQQQQQQSHTPFASMPCAFPDYNDADALMGYQQYSPIPAAYSGYTSPSSAFSPLSLPYSSIGSQQCYSPSQRSLPAHQVSSSQQSSYTPSQTAVSRLPELSCLQGSGAGSAAALDWDSFAVQGFDKYATPPTPEDFVQPPRVETKLATEESIPYQPLEDDESDGEILYGMGLYDTPEKEPVIDFHQSTILSLLGASGTYSKPAGKGLKLEDAWEPPASDDEEEGEEDADADDDDQ